MLSLASLSQRGCVTEIESNVFLFGIEWVVVVVVVVGAASQKQSHFSVMLLAFPVELRLGATNSQNSVMLRPRRGQHQGLPVTISLSNILIYKVRNYTDFYMPPCIEIARDVQ